MKTALVLAALFALTATASAAMPFPDQQYTVLVCRDGNLDLVDAGTGIVIKSGGFAGITLAEVSENTFHGPMAVGTVGVHSVRQSQILAPVVYEGNRFKLVINTHKAPLRNGMFASKLTAEINGKSYERKDMACEFYAHTM